MTSTGERTGYLGGRGIVMNVFRGGGWEAGWGDQNRNKGTVHSLSGQTEAD